MNETSNAITASFARRADIAWRLTMALYALLLLSLLADHALLRTAFRAPVWLIQTAPLLLVMPGLLRRHYRSGIWLCFMVLFHFLVAVDNVVISGKPLFYSAMAALIIVLFITSMLFARWQART